ncbi:MAG: hypothetical protein ACK4KW_10940 [Gemmobacter sp.]
MGMMIGFGMGIAGPGARPGEGAVVVPPPPPPPPADETDANVLAIRSDGWTADYRLAGGTVPGTFADRVPFDPDTPANTVSVLRPGFDDAGQPITVTDVLRVTSEVRVPYNAGYSMSGWPLQREADGDDAIARVALSDFVYEGDVVQDRTNNSTRPYPDPQFVWLNPDHEICGNSLTLRAFVAHWHARNGRPVAAVRFVVSDGSDSVELLVNATTFVSYAASGLGCPAFVGTLDVSGLANGALTVDAIVYPWVGPAYQLSVDGLTGDADMHARTQTAWKNPARRYAYVTSAGTSGGSTSTDPATAAAAPFDTYANARAALNTANGGNLSGCVIRFGPGSWTVPGGSAITTPDAPFLLEPIDPADRATTIIEPVNTSVPSTNLEGKLICRDLTLNRIAGTSTLWRAGSSAEHVLVLERCLITNSGTGVREQFIRGRLRWWLIDCEQTGDPMHVLAASAANKNHGINVVGCAGLSGNLTTNLIASRPNGMTFANTDSNRIASSAGAVCAFNRIVKNSNSERITATGTFLNGNRRGIAIVGNLLVWESGTQPFMGLFTDSGTRTPTNVVTQMNSVPFGGDGGRVNFMYTATSDCLMEGQIRSSIWPRWACKTDVFDSDASQIGGWPTAFHTGWRDNLMWEGGSVPNAYVGPGSWRREAQEPNLVFPASALTPATQFEVLDGFHVPRADSLLPRVPAGHTCYGNDLRGVPVPGDGTAFAGAVQRG